MIARIRGSIIEAEDNSLIVDVHGVGYRVVVGKKILAGVRVGDQATFRIHYYVADDRRELYGFLDPLEEHYFNLLLTVPSVGAKTARSILDIAEPGVLAQAIAEEDYTLLTKVSGVGKRTAERIVVELKEKIGVAKSIRAGGALQSDTIEALISIGFTPAQARAAAGKLPRDISTVEEAVKLALKATAR